MGVHPACIVSDRAGKVATPERNSAGKHSSYLVYLSSLSRTNWRAQEISAVKPRYHATEDGRWDYRVMLVFKSPAAAIDSVYEDAVKKQLFPDQETFQREEQRRFEILDAHWDLPIVEVDLEP